MRHRHLRSRARHVIRVQLLLGAVALFILISGANPAIAQAAAPRAKAWADIAALPDFGGVWVPDVNDQRRQEKENSPPWRSEVAPQIDQLIGQEQAGHPFLILSHCLPHGMPSWMLITHNAFEILMTPGRVTLLGEVDGNRMRRIYTDGRTLPQDPDPTLHGYSIGRWNHDTLEVETDAILPQAYIAISEAVGLPNNGGMHVKERLHLLKPNLLADDLEITAPKVLAKPWTTTRLFKRYPDRPFEITEGECVQEDLTAGTDSFGNAIFVPNPQNPDGSVRPVQ
jgi:hypothetical protein